MRVASLLWLLLVGGPAAFAQQLTLTACARQVVEPTALAAQLRIELAAADEFALQIDCSDAPDELRLRVLRRQPAAQSDGTFAFADVLPAHRPRTLALAIAELARQVEAPPPEASPPSPVVATPTATRPELGSPAKRVRNLNTIRLTKRLSIGLGVSAVVLAVIGGPLLSIGLNTAPERPVGLIAPGATLVALSGLSVVGTAASLGVLGYELRF